MLKELLQVEKKKSTATNKKIINRKHKIKVGNGSQKNIPKPVIMRRGEECRILKMHFKLQGPQFKTILCIYKILYQNLLGGSSCHGSAITNLISINEDVRLILTLLSGLRIWHYHEIQCRS